MRQENNSRIEQQILKIKFGILKASKTFALKSPISFMIEAIDVIDGCVFCRASDTTMSSPGVNSKVILKFIQKQEGLFIKLTGHVLKTADGKNDLIKIRIDEAYCFQKKSTSPYTSFLQTLGVFTGNFKKVGQAV